MTASNITIKGEAAVHSLPMEAVKYYIISSSILPCLSRTLYPPGRLSGRMQSLLYPWRLSSTVLYPLVYYSVYLEPCILLGGFQGGCSTPSTHGGCQVLYWFLFLWSHLVYCSLPDWERQVRDFPRKSIKIFTFRVKLSDSIFFLLGLSPIVKLIWHEKQIF